MFIHNMQQNNTHTHVTNNVSLFCQIPDMVLKCDRSKTKVQRTVTNENATH